ncbi:MULTISPECIES: lipopolysaccharide biosynthesis protein [unclassified Halomonas]|uniref:lipopolysaccharide biosynthesis protein n=1 Tax=unclassified Halomonas TaxID=2609666 RepID=UPI001C9801FB|nr:MULTISPECIES: lipopolysaccharide biosynthesis protein [unclassified Halomonas]MBY5925425.1 lipopolysaccharide biosynthesis protein [Halomonas sp. DP4Y7-2]MBY6232757.1 lipopolysaccharide biosynthesis protein [Halomonas sp. DP4Y7-1]
MKPISYESLVWSNVKNPEKHATVKNIKQHANCRSVVSQGFGRRGIFFLVNRSLKKSGKVGFFWMLMGTIGQNILQVASLLVLARFLSPEDFGVVSLAVIIVSFLKVFSELGVGPALVQKKNISVVDIGTANVISLSLGLVCASAIYLSSAGLADFFGMPQLEDVLKVLALMLPVASLSVVGQSLMQRRLRFKRLSSYIFISYLLGYGFVSIGMSINGYGIWSLVFAHLTQSVVMLALLLICALDSRRFGFNVKSAINMMTFGVGYSLARVANFSAGQGDNIVIGKLLGAEQLGLYGRAYQIVTFPAIMFGSVVDKVYFPIMAEMKSDYENLSRLYVSSVLLSSLLFSSVAFYCYVFSNEIVLILFGESWIEMAPILKILSFAMAFRIGYKYSDNLVMAVGRVYKRATIQVLYASFVVIFAVVGSTWGVEGVAVGVVVAVMLNYFLMMVMVWKIISFSCLHVLIHHVKHFCLAAIATSVYVFLFGINENEGIPSFLLHSLVYYMIFFALCYCVKGALKEEIDSIRFVIKKD